MFQLLRRLIFPIIIIVLVFFVAMIILEWGADISSSRNVKNTVGKINGEEIPWQVFDRYYNTLIRQEQEKNDADLTVSKVREIRNQAWQQLVVDHLLDQEIAKYKIAVTDEEMFNYLRLYPPQEIQQAPQFMSDGKFDYQKYVNTMVDPNAAPFWASIEQYVMPNIERFKLQQEVVSAVRVTPAEVMQAFLDSKEELEIGYIYVGDKDLRPKAPEPTEAEMKAYYDAHLEDYAVKERSVLHVVTFKKDPSSDDWSRVLYQMNDIYDSLAAGASFEEYARTLSEDNSAQNGGDLGWFERGRMVAPFDSAVFSMQVGQISRPVKTMFGYHIIKLLDIRGKQNPTTGKMDEERHAAHILLKVEASDETIAARKAAAEEFVEAVKTGDFVQVATQFNYKIDTTRAFTEDDYIPIINLKDEKMQETIAQAKVNYVSNVIEGDNGFYVYRMAERIEAGHRPYSEVMASVKRSVQTEWIQKAAMDSAAVMRRELVAGLTLPEVSRKHGFPYAVKDKITRTSVIPNIGKEPSVLAAAFALESVNQISEPVAYRNGVAILKLVARTSPDVEEFNRTQDSLYQQVLQKRQQDFYNKWYNNLFKNANVENWVEDFYTGNNIY